MGEWEEIVPTRLETTAIVVFYISEYLLIFLSLFMAGWVSSFSPLSAARVVKR